MNDRREQFAQRKKPEKQYAEAHWRWVQWASEREIAMSGGGYPKTSTTYRMMREGDAMPGSGGESLFAHRQRRTEKDGLILTPKNQAKGKSSRRFGSAGIMVKDGPESGMTGPEMDADDHWKVKTMEALFRQMPEEWACLIVLRYEEREESHSALARDLDMDRKEVTGYLRAALAWTHNMLCQRGQVKAA